MVIGGSRGRVTGAPSPLANRSHSLADLHTKFSGACPLQDPILSFSHTFSLKSAYVGGPHPPQNGSMSPPTGNPGSAPANSLFLHMFLPKSSCIGGRLPPLPPPTVNLGYTTDGKNFLNFSQC